MSTTAATSAGRVRAAVAGLASAGAGLGVAELAAAASRTLRSPVVSVGDGVIRVAPPGVKEFAIAVFGTNDKVALLVGIGVLLAAYAALAGIVARRRPLYGDVAIALFGAVGAWAAIGTTGQAATVLPSVVGAIAAALALRSLIRLATPSPVSATAGADQAATGRPDPGSRRAFLTGAGLTVLAAAGAGSLGRVLQGRFAVAASRAELVLPAAARSVDLPVPAGAHPEVEGLAPFLTPNADFYRIDTALQVPRIDPASHVVRVTGMVDRPLEIPFRDLLERDLVDIPITLTCVSNEVGGDLVGTAVWRGVRLADVLEEAGVRPEADQIVGRAVDGYTCGFPVSAAFDRDALIAVGMNDEPLPLEHGFPVRLVTPGLYGYVSATKWLAEIELTTFDAFDQYWVPRGWDEQAPIKTMSRIDVPAPLATVAPGTLAIAGVAWAQTRGIERVEVRIDDEDWRDADLAPAVNDVTWRQWSLPWEATAGRHRITVRATDATGEVQTEDRASPKPDGASGWHQVLVTVRA